MTCSLFFTPHGDAAADDLLEAANENLEVKAVDVQLNRSNMFEHELLISNYLVDEKYSFFR